jgi:hypothetical protein
MEDRTYQSHTDDHGEHILVFDGDGVFVRKVFVPRSEFRPTAFVWILDDRFRTLFQANSHIAYRWLEENPDRVLAKQVGVGKDFQILSVSEFQELYG